MKESFKNLISPFNVLKVAIIAVVGIIIFGVYENTYEQQILQLRKEKDHYFRTSIQSPFEDKSKFHGLAYFEPNEKYKVIAELKSFDKDSVYSMLSSDGRKIQYKKYGLLTFKLDSMSFQLVVFQSLEKDARQTLFLPFTDKTSGEQTYISGRYLDLLKTNNNTIEVDFNKAYHPYCVYSYRFSCPLPPADNYLNIPIFAGEKLIEETELEK